MGLSIIQDQLGPSKKMYIQENYRHQLLLH